MKVVCKVCIWRAERRALARATTSMQRTTPLHAPFAPPSAHASATPLCTPWFRPDAPTLMWHMLDADCMVLESRAACLQMLQGLSCNRRADASGTSLTQRSSLADVLDHQEAAEAAYYDMESVPRLTPWCSTGRL